MSHCSALTTPELDVSNTSDRLTALHDTTGMVALFAPSRRPVTVQVPKFASAPSRDGVLDPPTNQRSGTTSAQDAGEPPALNQVGGAFGC